MDGSTGFPKKRRSSGFIKTLRTILFALRHTSQGGRKAISDLPRRFLHGVV